MRVTKIMTAVAASALLLAGCGSSSSTTTSSTTPAASTTAAATGSETSPATAASSTSPVETTAAPTTSDLKVGMAYDVGGRGDKSFNDAAAAGLDKAKAEFGFAIDESTAANNEGDPARIERLNTMVDNGDKVIIAVGFAWAPAVAEVAKGNPDVQFAIVDSTDAKGDNVANLTFAEHEGSYLVGVAAALKSKTNHVGFVGGVETPLIQKFEAGFVAGAKSVKSDIKVDVKYLTQPPDFSGFGDPAKGKSAAEGMYQGGADVVYHAAGGSGGGVFQAAKAASKMAIGVDSDQYNTADPSVKDVIITSMLKKVDVAVYDYLKGAVAGTFTPGEKSYNLQADGVGYSTTGGMVDDIKDQLEKAKADIAAGTITVPTAP